MTEPARTFGHRTRFDGRSVGARSMVAAVALGLVMTACSPRPSGATGPPLSTSSSTVDLEVEEASIAATEGCELLREWVNAAVADINEASSTAAEAGSPVEVRQAFVDALTDVETILTGWPDRVEASIPGESETVIAFRDDLIRRSSEAMEVLGDMRDRVRAWPDDDTETRNARTQQAFIWFEGVMAEMKPDLGPYEGTPLGRELETAAACELTIRP